jgi:hypothetical protein
VPHHAHTVAEYGSAREGRRRVNGRDADPALRISPAVVLNEGVGERTLAGAWRTGDADEQPRERQAAGRVPLESGCGLVDLGQPVRLVGEKRHQTGGWANGASAVVDRGADQGGNRWRHEPVSSLQDSAAAGEQITGGKQAIAVGRGGPNRAAPQIGNVPGEDGT